MPMHLRIPWVASTSLIWTCILSAMRGDAEQVELSAEDAMDLAGGGQGKGIELLDFVTGTISEKPSYLYDATKAHILVTATGENARARRRPRGRPRADRALPSTSERAAALVRHRTATPHPPPPLLVACRPRPHRIHRRPRGLLREGQRARRQDVQGDRRVAG